MQRKKIQDGGETSRVIALGGIVPNAWNKRGDEGIPELAASIAARGQLEEIVVRPVGSKYEIVAGERRWRALRHNQATEVRCHVMEIDEATARAITFIENAERKRLTPFEEAEEIAGMAEAGAVAEEIAAQIGRPAAFVRRRLALRVLDLKAVEKTAEQGGMSAAQIPLLALELLAAGPEIKRADLPPWALVSIHAPRAGRDRRPDTRYSGSTCFNPRAPRGARLGNRIGSGMPIRVSIHAPRAGRDT